MQDLGQAEVDGALEVYGKLVEVTNQLAAVEQVRRETRTAAP